MKASELRNMSAEQLTAKLKELKEILTKHKDGRVIIFFDYDIKKSQRCYSKQI